MNTNDTSLNQNSPKDLEDDEFLNLSIIPDSDVNKCNIDDSECESCQ